MVVPRHYCSTLTAEVEGDTEPLSFLSAECPALHPRTLLITIKGVCMLLQEKTFLFPTYSHNLS